LRELASHADRAEINPNITKREALALKRKLTGVEQEKTNEQQEAEWLRDNRRAFRELYEGRKDNLWRIRGKRHVIYVMNSLSYREALQAAENLVENYRI
jgi:hypothetical protein